MGTKKEYLGCKRKQVPLQFSFLHCGLDKLSSKCVWFRKLCLTKFSLMNFIHAKLSVFLKLRKVPFLTYPRTLALEIRSPWPIVGLALSAKVDELSDSNSSRSTWSFAKRGKKQSLRLASTPFFRTFLTYLTRMLDFDICTSKYYFEHLGT